MSTEMIYRVQRPAGTFSLRPMQAADAALIHSWVTRDYARFWGMQNAVMG